MLLWFIFNLYKIFKTSLILEEFCATEDDTHIYVQYTDDSWRKNVSELENIFIAFRFEFNLSRLDWETLGLLCGPNLSLPQFH